MIELRMLDMDKKLGFNIKESYVLMSKFKMKYFRYREERKFPIMLILTIASQLSCEAIFKISSKNAENCRRKSKIRLILVI